MIKDFLRVANRNPGLHGAAWVMANDDRPVETAVILDIGQPDFAQITASASASFAISLLGRHHDLYPCLPAAMIGDAFCPHTEDPKSYLKDVVAITAHPPAWVDAHAKPWLRWRILKQKMASAGMVYTTLPPNHPLLSWVSQSGRLLLTPEPIESMPLEGWYVAPTMNHRSELSKLADPSIFREVVRVQQAYFLRLAIAQPPYQELKI